eukprot:TRINITY_DN12875_c0_g1_i1.p4 TRINITY_DN12875_c0_g1~~TRINITY_DN12875_c0_g1_i1.p4  ORF type:complete len:163 (+),score=16.75 TRINITY_DN12875_c0_g1_i1:286-774(+)
MEVVSTMCVDHAAEDVCRFCVDDQHFLCTQCVKGSAHRGHEVIAPLASTCTGRCGRWRRCLWMRRASRRRARECTRNVEEPRRMIEDLEEEKERTDEREQQVRWRLGRVSGTMKEVGEDGGGSSCRTERREEAGVVVGRVVGGLAEAMEAWSELSPMGKHVS